MKAFIFARLFNASAWEAAAADGARGVASNRKADLQLGLEKLSEKAT